MATKPLQLDDEGKVMDEETRKTQKGYEAYEREQAEAQRKLEERDKRMIEGARKIKEKVKSVMPFKKGGKVKEPTMTYQTYSETGKPAGMKTISVKKMSAGGSASKRADGCAVRGKTKGRMV